MTIGAMPQCYECEHFIEEKGPETCQAFPDGIPEEILGGEHDHKQPFPNDNGIRFKKKKRN